MSRRLVSLLLGVVLLAAACGGEGEQGYGGEFEDGFVESCEAAVGPGQEAVCQCTYDRLEQTVAFERAESLDRTLREDPEEPLPDDIAALISTCVAGSVPPSIVTTTTADPDAPSTTTTVAGDGSTTTTTGEAG